MTSFFLLFQDLNLKIDKFEAKFPSEEEFF